MIRDIDCVIARLPVSTAILWAGLLLEISPASAETARRYWPEINGFFNRTEQTRLMLMAFDQFTEETNKKGQDTESRIEEIGANLDFTLKPLFRKEAQDPDWERERYLWTRIEKEAKGGGQVSILFVYR